MEWISIEDRLPDTDINVIGYRPMASSYGDEVITILKYEGSNNIDLNGIAHGFERSHHVTHWMPLPNPPQP